MDTADPEGKRPYPSYATGPPAHHHLPHHRQPEHVVAAQSQPYSLPPPPHQPQAHPQLPSTRPSAEPHSAPHYPPAPAAYHESFTHDPNSSRNLPAPPGPPHGYGAARPGYHSAVEASPQYPVDPYRRTSSTPSQGNPQSENALRPIHLPNSTEAPHVEGPPMNHPQYSQGPSPEHLNGAYNGIPLSHHEHPPTPVSYAPPPYGPNHPPPTPYSYAPNGTAFGTGPRKKQVRATQACDACRQRKQKCNEERPCAFCSEVGLKCEYREVPPPKQDRSMMMLMDKLTAMAESQARLEEHASASRKESRDIRRRLEALERAMKIKQPELLNNSVEDTRSSTVDMDVETSGKRSTSQETSSAAFSKALPRTETGDNTPPTFHAVPRSTAAISKSKAADMDDELFVPTEHTTGAHNLLKWPVLKQLINLNDVIPKEIHPKEQYPKQLEIKRGLMKLYARGEGPKHGDRTGESPGTPNANDAADDSSSNASVKTDSTWGTGFHSPSNVDSPPLRSESNAGGLNPDGTLKLDRYTVQELFESFRDTLWVLHPCIPMKLMVGLINTFKHMYSHDSSPAGRSPFPANHEVSGSESPFKKRKRSHGGIHISGTPGSPNGRGQRSRVFPERSINNALVLLILALGKISLHKKPIPALPSDNKEPSWLPAASESPCNPTKPSPFSTSSLQSPVPEPHQFTPRSGTASVDGYVPNRQKDSGRKNFDVIPGLAYYAYATDILGNLQGGNDTSHAQAYILAAVYCAQLVRVMDSWSWLTQATRACQILVQTDNVVNKGNRTVQDTDLRRDNIRFLYWTCLQLESDVLAELDALSASGLYFFEFKISYPRGVFHEVEDLSEPTSRVPEDMMLYYSGQIHIRRILNKLHKTNFYKQSEDGQRKSENGEEEEEEKEEEEEEEEEEMQWEGVESEEATYQRLTELLDGWKNLLPPGIQWDEEHDPPATNINAARLRAKYYGARYVLNRPFLLKAMRPFGEKAKKSDVSQETIIRAARTCVAAAMRSTIAFDGLGDGLNDRLIVTNIFGTAHAQFGNCLMLAATHRSGVLSDLVPREDLNRLLNRTIRFLSNYEAHSPTLKCDKNILENLRDNLDRPLEKATSMSVSSSFGSNK